MKHMRGWHHSSLAQQRRERQQHGAVAVRTQDRRSDMQFDPRRNPVTGQIERVVVLEDDQDD